MKTGDWVYCTKYALSGGIERMRVTSTYKDDYVTCENKFLRRNRDVFATKAEAEADAKKRALRKITSVKKQLTKLEQLAVQPKWSSE